MVISCKFPWFYYPCIIYEMLFSDSVVGCFAPNKFSNSKLCLWWQLGERNPFYFEALKANSHLLMFLLFHQCFSSVSPVLQQCFTSISPVFHQCFTNVSQVFHPCFTSVSPVFHQCFTSAVPLFYHCFTSVSPVLSGNHLYPP